MSRSHWYYAGPYVPSGVVYDPDRMISDKPSPSYSVWLVPGYENAYEAFGVIDLYNPPSWFRPLGGDVGKRGERFMSARDRSWKLESDALSVDVVRLEVERDDLLKANQILHALIGNRDKEVDRLRAERDHWRALVSRADRAQFPFDASAFNQARCTCSPLTRYADAPHEQDCTLSLQDSREVGS